MFKALAEAERCAVRGHAAIRNMTAGKYYGTYDLSLAILHEEAEHKSWFPEFPGEGSSRYFMRRGESSLFVSKIMRSEGN